jgi:phage gpG-like protein
MADFLSVQVTGNLELLQSLEQALARVQQPRELMERLGQGLEEAIQRRFDTKRDPDGSPWAPLRPSTQANYDRNDTQRSGRNAGQIVSRGSLLERTRQMRSSLATDAGTDYVEVGMSRLSDGGGWSIPLLHETGTTKMARRGLFFSNPDTGTLGVEDEAMLDEEIGLFLDDVFG